MKNIIFLILLGPLLFSQNFQTKDSLKVLAKSNFKSMEVFENKNGKLTPTRNYSYDKNKNEITIKNVSDKNKEWIKTVVQLDDTYRIIQENKIIEGMMISEKENKLVKKQVSKIKQYTYVYNSIQIESYNNEGHLYKKEFNLVDDKDRLIYSTLLLNASSDIVVAQTERYNWIDNNSYDYEKLTFNAPKSRVEGVYKLNPYGDRHSFKGSMTINDKTELLDFSLEEKIKKFDSKGNLMKIYILDNGKENILEKRKIVY
ncbi:hypothetical protein ACM46_15015 [Chryseobacterium angstadtii]|uniref:Uncharacterized protein n=1 Tax=Chryseobacterium angstadtii TaxID=558151 RepID=A0A0J7KW45_9FLAO|nr:hypothetical protein [Chryseobacterium angstadtii]KMQ61345.1 hypothetical protein ACM46_15015 [Chryseobacterium angstadtii]